MNAKEQAVSSDQVKRVERFNCTNGGARYCYGCYQMTPDNEYGDYVSYDDYAALLQQLAERDAAIDTARQWALDEQANGVRMHERAHAAEARVRELERDAARLDYLDSCSESYGFENEHLGNRWMIEGAYANIRKAIDYEMSTGSDAAMASGGGG